MIGRASAFLLLFLVSVVGAAACAERPEEHGRALYAQHGCAVCHGADGRGAGASARRLDVPPTNLLDAHAYKRGTTQSAIATSIRKGSGTMPAFPDITEPEASDIAAWIASQARGSGQ